MQDVLGVPGLWDGETLAFVSVLAFTGLPGWMPGRLLEKALRALPPRHDDFGKVLIFLLVLEDLNRRDCNALSVYEDVVLPVCLG